MFSDLRPRLADHNKARKVARAEDASCAFVSITAARASYRLLPWALRMMLRVGYGVWLRSIYLYIRYTADLLNPPVEMSK